MQGVQGDNGGGIPGESPDESKWEGDGGTTELRKPGCGGRAMDIPNVIPGEGRPAELPGGGMPGPSGDKDGDAGALPALACPRNRGHSGGGKPPQPTVQPMEHAGNPVIPEQQATCHRSVCQGIGAEEAAARGGRDEGELREGLRGTQGAAGERHDI